MDIHHAQRRSAHVFAVLTATAALALPATASADGIYSSSQLLLSGAQTQFAPATSTTAATDAGTTFNTLTNVQKSKHDAAMAAVQNTR